MKRFFYLQLIAFLLLLQPATAHFLVVPTVSTEPPAAVVQQSVEAFKNLSKKEQKSRLKQATKEAKAMRKNGGADDRTILLVILAILLPPLAVYLHQNEINTKFWISLILWLLFWLPGAIYALLVVLGEL